MNGNAFLAGLQTGAQIGGSIRDRKQRQKEREEDLAIASELRNWQKSRDDRDFNYRAGRDTVADTRYASETAYRAGRDTVTDQRAADDMAFHRERAGVADSQFDTRRGDQLEEQKMARELRNREIDAKIKTMEQKANGSPYTQTIEDLANDGTVTGTRRITRTPFGSESSPAATTMTSPATSQQTGGQDAAAALQWARANPNDPRAKAILQRLGVR